MSSPARDASEVVLFSTPPTPNGGLHLGHFAGPYLAADVLRRVLSRPDAQVAHLSGFDDHTSYVWTKAHQDGVEPCELAGRFTAAIRADWAAMGVVVQAPDNPQHDPGYRRFCADAVDHLVRNGHVVARQAESLYDKETGEYLHEALVTGGCPRCGAGSDGDACEACGRPHQAVELIDPVSTLRPDAVLTRRTGTHLFFRLEPHHRYLDQHVRTASMSEQALLLSQDMLAEPLPDIRISHEVAFGLPVTAVGVDARLYPWFEMGLLYLWELRCRFGEDSLRVGPDGVTVAEPLAGTRIAHCFGFDNVWFHTLLFPALHQSLHPRLPVPSDYVVNELLHLDGEKFSTSRGHLITAGQALEHADRDHLRLYLAMIRPEEENTNFTAEDFQRRVNTELVTPLTELAARFTALTADAFDGALPDAGAWTGTTQRYHRTVIRLSETVAEALSLPAYSSRRAVRALRELVAETTELLTAARPLVGMPAARDRLRTSVALAAVGYSVVCHYLGALAPEFGERLAAAFQDAVPRPHLLDFFPSGTMVEDRLPPLPTVDADGLRASEQVAAR